MFTAFKPFSQGDLAWRLRSRKIKTGREVSLGWLRAPAALHLCPHSVQVEEKKLKSEMNATRYRTKVGTRDVLIDFWDTAGQERFNTMHRSYYHQAHACIMVFDATRKVIDSGLEQQQTIRFSKFHLRLSHQVTYKNLSTWYTELRQYRPAIPTLLAANKIDENMEASQSPFLKSDQDQLFGQVTTKSFAFAGKNELPLYYVSAADGTNVVKMFRSVTVLNKNCCLCLKTINSQCSFISGTQLMQL